MLNTSQRVFLESLLLKKISCKHLKHKSFLNETSHSDSIKVILLYYKDKMYFAELFAVIINLFSAIILQQKQPECNFFL